MKKTRMIRQITLLAAALFSVAAYAQDAQQKSSKAWELGVGGSVMQFNRVAFSNFQSVNGNYVYDMTINHAVWGGQLYVARELGGHFYLDLQGTGGYVPQTYGGGNKLYGMAGLGLQWRFGELLGSQYIDPYLRVGANYMYKGFDINYAGDETVGTDAMKWILENRGNKHGADRTQMTPVSLGGGINMWLNDRFGIGMQCDYLYMPYANVANSIQGSAKLLFRLGGKSKKPAPVVQYVDRPVEKVVEKVVEKEKIVEKIVEKEAPMKIEKSLVYLFDQIFFEFDSYKLTSSSENILDLVAEQLKDNENLCYLITGQTDARGSAAYNQKLSENRAREVVKGLISRGVPSKMLKYRGIGSSIAAIAASGDNQMREGDRKTVIELVSNPLYWNSGVFKEVK